MTSNGNDLILFRIAASHFLWKMVRKTVAALADVGRGSLKAGAVAALLEPAAAPWEPSAPGSGLFLESVLYPGESLQRPLRAAFPVTDRSPSGESWASMNRR